MKLSVVREGKKTKLFLDGTEIKGVVEYNIKSSAEKSTELTITMLVDYPANLEKSKEIM